MRWTGKFPNIQAGVIAWLKAELPVGAFVVRNSVLPKDWPGPGSGVTVVVARAPGSGPAREGETAASIDISLYAGTLDQLGDAIPVIEHAMAELPATLYDEVGYSSTFGDIPYANPAVRRADATYDIETRGR